MFLKFIKNNIATDEILNQVMFPALAYSKLLLRKGWKYYNLPVIVENDYWDIISTNDLIVCRWTWRSIPDENKTHVIDSTKEVV